MLRIYPVVLEWLDDVAVCVKAIARRDANLAKQLRRSSTAVVLNLAEGMGALDGVKTNCYRTALREMRESMAAIEIAVRFEYVPAFNAEFVDRQGRIVGTLVRLAL